MHGQHMLMLHFAPACCPAQARSQEARNNWESALDSKDRAISQLEEALNSRQRTLEQLTASSASSAETQQQLQAAQQKLSALEAALAEAQTKVGSTLIVGGKNAQLPPIMCS